MDSWKLEPAQDLGLPLGARLRSVEREQGLIPYLVHLICSVWVKVILRLYHRMEIIGREHLPKNGPFVLASNHSSHLDVAVLASALNWRLRCNAFPIAAGDTFFETPIVAVASAVVINALPMWRKRRGIATSLRICVSGWLGGPAFTLSSRKGRGAEPGRWGSSSRAWR